MLEKVERLISEINRIHLEYPKDYFETGKVEKVNLKHTFTKVPIRAYRLNLHEAINDYLMRADVKDIAYFYRVKTSESILDKIEWGDSGIFDNHNYILTSATYTLKNFQNGYRIRIPGKPATFGNGRLLPAAATQELIFKRVSAYNLSYGDFINSDSLKKTGGIKYD
jgi:hypothetical protein